MTWNYESGPADNRELWCKCKCPPLDWSPSLIKAELEEENEQKMIVAGHKTTDKSSLNPAGGDMRSKKIFLICSMTCHFYCIALWYLVICPGYFHQNIPPCSGTADSRQNSVSLECESYGGAICRGSRNLIELSSPPCPGWHSPINDKNICIHWKIFQLSTSRSWQQTDNRRCMPRHRQPTVAVFLMVHNLLLFETGIARVWQKASLDPLDPTMTVMNPHYDGSGQSRNDITLDDHFGAIKNI